MELIRLTATPWATTRPDRARRNRCGMCGAAEDSDCGDNGFNHTGRTWRIGLTCRGAIMGKTDVILTTTCQATTENVYVWDWATAGDHGDVAIRDHMLYRGACLGCGWAGPERRDENTAVEDAHDHALPLWRTVPVVNRPPYDATDKQRNAWAAVIARLYDAHGLPGEYAPGNGGVIRTMRTGCGTRSHFTRTYYDVCAGVELDRPIDTTPAEPPPTLF